jgi:hypothetical protein
VASVQGWPRTAASAAAARFTTAAMPPKAKARAAHGGAVERDRQAGGQAEMSLS